MYELRPHQSRVACAIQSWLESKTVGHSLAVMPTGAGKSIQIAETCRQAMNLQGTFDYKRILMLTHNQELVEQNHNKISGLFPENQLGVYCAGLGKKETGRVITFGSIQSVSGNIEKIGAPDLIIVDEAHMIPFDANTQYRKAFDEIENLLGKEPRILGFTATPYRLSGGSLITGNDKVFDSIIANVKVKELIDAGYLCPVTSKPTKIEPDRSKIRKRGGEFVEADIQSAYMDGDLTPIALNDMIEKTADRKSGLIFASGVEHAQMIADFLSEKGFVSCAVHGGTPKDERSKILSDFKAGKIQFLSNCNILTTGFDAPNADVVVLMRPTESTGLYIQMIGRGLRISPETGKQNCLVLDYAGNIERHGLIDDPNITEHDQGDGERDNEAPTKSCPDCGEYNHAAVRECAECGHVFKSKAPNIEMKPSTAELMEDSELMKWVQVSKIEYLPHTKQGKPPTLRVNYFKPYSVFGINDHQKFASEFVAFESTNMYAQHKAAQWWKQRSVVPTIEPETVSEALQRLNEIKDPMFVQIASNGKYKQVVGISFTSINSGVAA